MTGVRQADVIRVAVGPADVGQRLDRLLAASGLVGSRARAQVLLRKGAVSIGGVPRKASYFVRPGDVIEATVRPTAAASGGAQPPKPEALPLEVLYEDEDVLAVNKAPGIVVHPAPGHWQGTLVNALVHYLGGPPGAGDPTRPGIVHRLDKDTSGVLLVAKNAEAHEHMARQFQDRTIRKEYVAIVRGRMSTSEGLIDRPIGRHPHQRQRMSVHTRRGRAAATRYVVTERYGAVTVLRLFPTTGRTHQLRVHLAAIGHPIVGDLTYGRMRSGRHGAHGWPHDLLHAFPRQALHATALEFSHPRTGVRIDIHAPLPADLCGLLTALRTEGWAAA